MDINCPICQSTETNILSAYPNKTATFSDRELRKCEHCHNIFVWPTFSKTELDEYNSMYWELGIQGKNEKIAQKHYYAQAESRIRYLSDLIPLSDISKVLDIGAGHGFFRDTLIELGNTDIDYTVIESDTGMREIFTQKGFPIIKIWKAVRSAHTN